MQRREEAALAAIMWVRLRCSVAGSCRHGGAGTMATACHAVAAARVRERVRGAALAVATARIQRGRETVVQARLAQGRRAGVWRGSGIFFSDGLVSGEGMKTLENDGDAERRGVRWRSNGTD